MSWSQKKVSRFRVCFGMWLTDGPVVLCHKVMMVMTITRIMITSAFFVVLKSALVVPSFVVLSL